MPNLCSTCTPVKSMQHCSFWRLFAIYIYIPTRSTHRKAVGRDCSSSIRKRFTHNEGYTFYPVLIPHFSIKKKYTPDRNISTGELSFSCIITENNITFAHETIKRVSHGKFKIIILSSFYSEQAFNIFPFLRLQISTKLGLHHSKRFSR